MKDETREFVIPIRVTFSEKEEIKKRSKKVNQSISEYMRETALGYEIREKPDSNIFWEFTEALRKVEINLRNLSSQAQNLKFIDEQKLKRDREEYNNLIIEMKSKFK